MENPFILPENKPPEKVILVFVYMLTMILLHKQTYRSNGKGHLPGTFFMRCRTGSLLWFLALFDRLLKIPYLTSSPILWRSYIYYEYNCGHYYNAKHLFYSAINNCPYSKTLWLDCIRILRPVMSTKQRVARPLAKIVVEIWKLVIKATVTVAGNITMICWIA